MRIWTVITVFWLAGLSNSTAQPLTIEDAVQYALEHNFELRQGSLEVSDADARISETLATGLPTLDGNLRYSYFPDVPNFLIPAQFADPEAPEGSFISLPAGTRQSVNASLDMNALIFDGSFFVGLRAARVFKDLTEKEVDATRQEVRWKVKRAFYSALLVSEQIGELDSNIENVGQLLDETRALHREGFAELLDVRRLELNYNTLVSQRDQLSGMDTITQNLLKFQMAWPMDEPIEIEGDLEKMANEWRVNKPEIDYDYDDRPDFRVLQVTEELNDINIRQIQMGYFPKIHAFASHTQNLQRDDLFNRDEIGWLQTTSIGATMTIPIFDGFDKRSRIQRARIGKEKVLEGQNQLRHAIDMEVKNQHRHYKNAQRALEDAIQLLDLSEEIYQTVLTKYREGMSTSFELIQAEQDLFDSRLQYLNALYEVVDSRTQLEQALGR
ncbi:MAG: TolC family protein [Saprospirales bacterium]|nr:MAG: TolC family protein [Saprospirales bacterium]